MRRRGGGDEPAAERGASSAEGDGVGRALVQAGARGPSGLEEKARAAYALVNGAATAGLSSFASSGDFNDVGRSAAEVRRQLVERVAADLRSGRGDVESIADYLVDSAMERAQRCVMGGGGIYAELWTLDEGRASVAAVSSRQRRGAAEAEAATQEVLVDEQPPSGEEPLRPLFRRVQPHVFARPTALALLDVFEVFRRRGRRFEYSAEEQYYMILY